MLGFDLVASAGRRSVARALAGALRRGIGTGLGLAAVVTLTAPVMAPDRAEAKGPGQTYCFYKTCHRVKTLAETQALVGRDMAVVASHYDSCKRDRFNPCGLTSSGEAFHSDRPDNAASPVLPDGTIVMVWSKTSKQAVVLRINNAGPYWGNRKLDLSQAAAKTLGIRGVGEVMLRVLKAPSAAEARYRKNRVYDPVPGPIGTFANLDAAHGAMSVRVALGQPGTLALAGMPPAPGGAEATFDMASALKTPLLPGFDLPRAGLAAAIAAQDEAERSLKTAMLPASVDVQQTREASIDARPVAVPANTPAVDAPRALTSRPLARRTIRTAVAATVATETAPATPAAVRVAAPVAKSRPAKRAVRAERRPSPAVEAMPVRSEKPKAATPRPAATVQKVWRQPRVVAEIHHEIKVGFTTYAERRYQPKPAPVKIASAVKSKKKPAVAKVSKSAVPAMASAFQPGSASKRAALPKSGKSAALKKGGGSAS